MLGAAAAGWAASGVSIWPCNTTQADAGLTTCPVFGGTELLLAPVKALVEGCKGVACGAEFTMWLTAAGQLLSAGCPQHGQLGHGTDHEYNAKDCAPCRCHPTLQGFGQSKLQAAQLAFSQHGCPASPVPGAPP